MDAIALLENLGVKQAVGMGEDTIKRVRIYKKNTTITLELL
jgi:hypothetical protein